jgi:hypothetical protein
MTATTSDRLRRAPAWQRALFTAACAYEVVAMWTDLPTVTHIVHRNPWLAAPILIGLGIHFIPDEAARRG